MNFPSTRLCINISVCVRCVTLPLLLYVRVWCMYTLLLQSSSSLLLYFFSRFSLTSTVGIWFTTDRQRCRSSTRVNNSSPPYSLQPLPHHIAVFLVYSVYNYTHTHTHTLYNTAVPKRTRQMQRKSDRGGVKEWDGIRDSAQTEDKRTNRKDWVSNGGCDHRVTRTNSINTNERDLFSRGRLRRLPLHR